MSENGLLNLYGDKVIKTTGSHGADIASQRIDDLDRKCIEYALTLKSENDFAIDIGCGLGIQGVRMAVLGVNTLLIDLMDVSETVESLSKLLGVKNLSVLIKDVRKITINDIQKPATLVSSQRFIHYLKFSEAQSLLSKISTVMPCKSRLYISASGLNSELGDGYKDKNKPVNERFSVLVPEMAEKHQIKEQVCLYTEKDIQDLIIPFGFKLNKVWTSSFGNIKSIFERL